MLGIYFRKRSINIKRIRLNHFSEIKNLEKRLEEKNKLFEMNISQNTFLKDKKVKEDIQPQKKMDHSILNQNLEYSKIKQRGKIFLYLSVRFPNFLENWDKLSSRIQPSKDWIIVIIKKIVQRQPFRFFIILFKIFISAFSAFYLAFYFKNPELFKFYSGYNLSPFEKLKLSFYLIVFFKALENPKLITNLASFLARFIGTEFINKFICRQLVRLLSLEVVVEGSKRLFKNNILKNMILGSPNWDQKIVYLIMKILKNPAVRDAIGQNLNSLIKSPFLEKLAADKLVSMVGNVGEYKEFLVDKTLEKTKDYLQDFKNMWNMAKK